MDNIKSFEWINSKIKLYVWGRKIRYKPARI